MIFTKIHLLLTLLYLTLILLASPSYQAITKINVISDVHGNLLGNNDAKYPPSSCCVVPTCNTPSRCYKTLTCGYMCSSGKYPPAEYSNTPGYRLRESYTRYACRFGDCKDYEFTCHHCPDPRGEEFSIYLVRDDCKDCYYH